MTDKKPEISQTSTAPTPSVSTSPGPATAAGAPKKTTPAGPKSRSVLVPAFIIVLLLAVALAAALWYQRQSFQQSQEDLASQVQDGARITNQIGEQAQQALSLAQQQSRQLAALEDSLRSTREQLDGLETALQTLTDSGSDLVLINDVDHLVTIAQQQLQLSGNVANAIISLETAQAQLARANRPQLASLQESINGDLEHLRAASTIDIGLLSTRLDELSGLVGVAPLLVPDDAAPEPVLTPPSSGSTATIPASSTAPSDAAAPWWRQGFDTARKLSESAWNSIRQELGEFITVRRVDDPTALLMSPDQATRFRETLRLRIMTAQLALMMKQPKVWTAETEVLVKALETRFDLKSREARQALNIARELSGTSIDVKLPTVTNSLQAIQTLREASAKEAEQGAIAAPSHNTAEPRQAPAASQPEQINEAPTGSQGEAAQPNAGTDAPSAPAGDAPLPSEPSEPSVAPADAVPTMPQG